MSDNSTLDARGLAVNVPRMDEPGLPAQGRRRVLFGMAHAGFFRNFEGAIERLCASGVAVHILLMREHKSITLDDYPLIADRDRNRGLLTVSVAGQWAIQHRAKILRAARDLLHYTQPELRLALDLRSRFVKIYSAPLGPPARVARLLAAGDRLPPFIRAGTERFLRGVERHLPESAPAGSAIEAFAPDIVVVSPMVAFDAQEVELAKAALRRGIPCLLAVASWDNLSNKGRIKVLPDMISVWNREMAREAEAKP